MSKNKKTTIYDIAEKAGVSRQTVSRVINNRQDVSEETRQRVKVIMLNLDYQPNAVAQILSRQRSNLLGVVTAGLKYFGPSRTLSGITNEAEDLGYGLLLKELDSFNSSNVLPMLNWFISHQVDGIIWAAPEIGENRSWIGEVQPAFNLPILFLTMEERKNLTIVTSDNFSGASMAVKHLLQQGRKNIGHISGPMTWWEAKERKRGWITELSKNGIEVTEKMWSQGNWSSTSGKQAFLDLVEKFPEMDAIFVGNDQMALSVLATSREIGRKIPEDLSVIGFDGIADSEFYSPSLSTVSQNLDELGRRAVDVLIAQIEQKNSGSINSSYTTIQPELIIRQSA